MSIQNEYPHRASGWIKYDPDRGGMRKNTTWWCVIELVPGLTGYLRWVYNNNWWKVHGGHRETLWNPIHRDHITVVRGEVPWDQYKSNWGWRNGEKIDFFYSDEIHIANNRVDRSAPTQFFYVNCWVPAAAEIRENLGLATSGRVNGIERKYHYHLTFAKNTAT